MDEEQVQDVQEAEEQTAAEESSPETNETAETQPEAESSDEPKVEEQEGQPEPSDGGNRKKNAQSRIRELVERNKELESQTVPENQVQQSPIGSGRFSDQLKGKAEVTPEDLDAAAERYVAQTAGTLVDLKLQPVLQQLQAEKLTADIDRVQSQYEELNPDSDNYDEALDNQLADMYRKYGGNAPLADYVSEQMSLIGARASKQTAKTNQEINKAQDNSALRPGTPRSEAPFEELSEAEMEKKLGIVR